MLLFAKVCQKIWVCIKLNIWEMVQRFVYKATMNNKDLTFFFEAPGQVCNEPREGVAQYEDKFDHSIHEITCVHEYTWLEIGTTKSNYNNLIIKN